MKSLHIFYLLLIVGAASCNKPSIPNPPGETAESKNTAPRADAGADIAIKFPLNEIFIGGSAYDKEDNIKSFSWAKISGPNSYWIENKDSLNIRVSMLEIGSYQFELTVMDSMGLYGKDTIELIVEERQANPNDPIFPNEIIFKNLTWIFPWYNSIEVKNSNNYLPNGLSFKVFIQRDNDPEWKEVVPGSASYDYFIEKRPDGGGIGMYNFGSLYIFYYGNDVSDTPSVKIGY
jgi:hypothetical protein